MPGDRIQERSQEEGLSEQVASTASMHAGIINNIVEPRAS